MAGCSPNANAEIISPQLGAIEVAKAAGAQVSAAATEAPPTLAEMTDEQIYAGLPDAVAADIANADPAHAQQLALTNGCGGCHSLDPTVQQPGPSWAGVGDRAVIRAQAAGDAGPAAYIYQSITAPNAFVVPNYASGIMPQTFGQQLSDQDIADLIVYLLSQRGQ
ncbi:MAG: cytochrome c [Caldilineaceae bacterium]